MTSALRPNGWHTVTLRLVVDDPELLIQFLKDAFDARGDFSATAPAVMQMGDSIVMVNGSDPREPYHALLYLYVDDADETYRQALRAGAQSLEEPTDLPYGDRRAMVKDPCGNDWQIATFGGAGKNG